jgi:AcrR family transcriptional regulator
MDRREAIADAAIAVLASDGSRGLTHRAVDRHLELPAGSTSYYFRTRQALVAAAAERMVALDRADIAAVGGTVEGLVQLVERWLRPRQRPRLVARFELFLGDSRESGAGPVAAARAAFVAEIEAALAAGGAPDPRVGAVVLMATIEGLLLDGLVGRRLARADLWAVLDAALHVALEPPGTRRRSRR